MANPKKKTDGEGGDAGAEQVESTEAAAPATETTSDAAAPTTTPDPRIAELEAQLAAALADRDAARATAAGLAADLEVAVDRRIHDLAAMRERFDQAWQERVGTPTPMPSPVRGPARRFAAALIRCHSTTGEKLTLNAGDLIPDEADLTGVGRDAIEER